MFFSRTNIAAKMEIRYTEYKTGGFADGGPRSEGGKRYAGIGLQKVQHVPEGP